MSAAVHLIASHLEQGVVVIGQEGLLHFAAALRVYSLADEKRSRILLQRIGPYRGSHQQVTSLARRRIEALDPFDRTLSPAGIQCGQLQR